MRRKHQHRSAFISILLLLTTLLTACNQEEPGGVDVSTEVTTSTPETIPLPTEVAEDDLRDLFDMTFAEIFDGTSPEFVTTQQGAVYYELPDDSSIRVAFSIDYNENDYPLAIGGPIDRFFDGHESFTMEQLEERFVGEFHTSTPEQGGESTFTVSITYGGLHYTFFLASPDYVNITHVQINN